LVFAANALDQGQPEQQFELFIIFSYGIFERNKIR
jgi:hypothetical protein